MTGGNDDGWDAADFDPAPAPESDVHETPAPVFSVTNPSGTVTAIASIAGRLRGVELESGSGSAHPMTESELAQEILLVGRLADQKARAELFTYLVDRTAEAGQDPQATARFLRDDVGLPTPEESAAAWAEAFGTQYLLGEDPEEDHG